MGQPDDIPPDVLIRAGRIKDSIDFAEEIFNEHFSEVYPPETDTGIRDHFFGTCRRDLEHVSSAVKDLSVEDKHEKDKLSIQNRLDSSIERLREYPIPRSDGKDGLCISPFASLLYMAASELVLKKEYTYSQVEVFFADLEKSCNKIFKPTEHPDTGHPDTGHLDTGHPDAGDRKERTPKMVGVVLFPRPGHVVIDSSHFVVTSTMPEVGDKKAFKALVNFYQNILSSDIRGKLEAYDNYLYTEVEKAKDVTKKALKRYKRAKKHKMGQEKGESIRSALTEGQTYGKMFNELKPHLNRLLELQSETALHAFAYSVDQNKIRDGCFRCQCQYHLQWYGSWNDASRIAEWQTYQVKYTYCWETLALAIILGAVSKDLEDIPHSPSDE